MNGFEELCKTIHHAFAYGLESNDMTHGEVISDISFALNKFAKENNIPEYDFDADYNDLYGESNDDA